MSFRLCSPVFYGPAFFAALLFSTNSFGDAITTSVTCQTATTLTATTYCFQNDSYGFATARSTGSIALSGNSVALTASATTQSAGYALGSPFSGPWVSATATSSFSYSVTLSSVGVILPSGGFSGGGDGNAEPIVLASLLIYNNGALLWGEYCPYITSCFTPYHFPTIAVASGTVTFVESAEVISPSFYIAGGTFAAFDLDQAFAFTDANGNPLDPVDPPSVPEPAVLPLFAGGLAALLLLRRLTRSELWSL